MLGIEWLSVVNAPCVCVGTGLAAPVRRFRALFAGEPDRALGSLATLRFGTAAKRGSLDPDTRGDFLEEGAQAGKMANRHMAVIPKHPPPVLGRYP